MLQRIYKAGARGSGMMAVLRSGRFPGPLTIDNPPPANCAQAAEERSMFSSELSHDGHTRRLTITRSGAGWQIREELDSRIVRTTNCSDWHRVERARQMFALENRLPVDPPVAPDAHSANR
jgi:hypothetical protein